MEKWFSHSQNIFGTDNEKRVYEGLFKSKSIVLLKRTHIIVLVLSIVLTGICMYI